MTPNSSVAILLTSVLLVVGVVVGLRRSGAGARDPQARLRQARDNLVTVVRTRWAEEARSRKLFRPSPLNLTWSLGGSFAGDQGGESRSRGDLADLPAVLGRVPRRQLAITGPRGGGATTAAVVLCLNLLDDLDLDRDAAGRPVPVLFGLARWNPATESLVDRLLADLQDRFPGVLPRQHPRETLVALIEAGAVLPVLDGLDDLRPDLRPTAVRALLASPLRERPWIITGSDAGLAALHREAPDLLTCAEARLAAPVAADVAAFLAGGRFGARWAAVAERLRLDPEGSVAQALSTPQMITLARAVYSHADAHPEDLLDAGDAEAVRAQILGAYLPAAYDATPDRAPVRAERWLGRLAAVGHGLGEFEWWHLGHEVPRIVPILIAALHGGLSAGVVTWAVAGPQEAAAAAGLVAAAFALLGFLIADVPQVPRGLVFRIRRPAGHLARSVGTALTFGLVLGVTVAVVAVFLVGWSAALVLFVVTTAGSTGVLAVLHWADATDVELRAEDPQSVLRADRLAALLNGITAGTVAGLLTGVAASATLALWPAVFAAVVVGAVGMAPVTFLFTAWGRYVLARWWFSVRGELPFDVLGFLDDACRRGVIQQVGPRYRFPYDAIRGQLFDPMPAEGRP